MREQAGVTLDQLATRARERGLKWSTARVIEFEKGKLRLTLPMLLAVAQSMAELTGEEISLADLVPPGSTWIRLTPEWVTERERLWTVLGFDPVQLGSVVDVSAVDPSSRVQVSLPVDALTATLAEQRAAKRIGARPRQVAMWAHLLWGKHLDAVVAERLPEDASPQARGHLTRSLVEQITREIKRYDGAAPTHVRTTMTLGELRDFRAAHSDDALVEVALEAADAIAEHVSEALADEASERKAVLDGDR